MVNFGSWWVTLSLADASHKHLTFAAVDHSLAEKCADSDDVYNGACRELLKKCEKWDVYYQIERGDVYDCRAATGPLKKLVNRLEDIYLRGT